MQFKKNIILIFCLVFLSFLEVNGDVSYNVEIKGVEDNSLKVALEASSQLLHSSEQTVVSMGALKRRSEADISNFVKVLHGFAYYNATVQYVIDATVQPVKVIYTIDPSVIYPFASFRLLISAESPPSIVLEQITLKDLGITLGEAALAEKIVHAEEALLHQLAQKGYPLAVIKKRDIIADQKEKSIHVTLEVDNGPLARFGETSIVGHTAVEEIFVRQKIHWQQGEPFNLCDIQTTQEALERSGLFVSTLISYGKIDSVTGELPMEIHLNESKHRSIAGGVSYTTQRGVGVMAEWDHRNVRGLGEKVNIQANIWNDTQDGRVSYVLPNFGEFDQDLLLLAEVEHQITKGYTETSFSASSTIDRKINERFRFSYGGMYKTILTQRSDNNGNFHLLKVPMQFRWSSANSLLDATSGKSFNFKITPTLQIRAPYYAYCPALFTGIMYQPLTKDHRFVFAGKATVGTIFGTSRHAIPPSERFYAGNESTLRGYRYLTVSPLGHDNKPLGGRSMAILSLEARYRATETIGLVGFYEVGNVYSQSFPKLDSKQLQSIGAGIRYHTPVGPIRLDVAVPLNKRKGLDGNYQIYMSIGQSF